MCLLLPPNFGNATPRSHELCRLEIKAAQRSFELNNKNEDRINTNRRKHQQYAKISRNSTTHGTLKKRRQNVTDVSLTCHVFLPGCVVVNMLSVASQPEQKDWHSLVTRRDYSENAQNTPICVGHCDDFITPSVTNYRTSLLSACLAQMDHPKRVLWIRQHTSYFSTKYHVLKETVVELGVSSDNQNTKNVFLWQLPVACCDYVRIKNTRDYIRVKLTKLGWQVSHSHARSHRPKRKLHVIDYSTPSSNTLWTVVYQIRLR